MIDSKRIGITKVKDTLSLGIVDIFSERSVLDFFCSSATALLVQIYLSFFHIIEIPYLSLPLRVQT